MLLRIASDLHLEAFPHRTLDQLVGGFLPPDDRDAGATLVLAGDICCGLDRLVEFLSAVEQRFAAVVYVPGNHEFYRHDLDGWRALAAERFKVLYRTRAALGDLEAFEVGGVRFLAATGWADGGRTIKERGDVGAYLNDFRLIRVGQRRFAVSDMAELNRRFRLDVDVQLRHKPFDGPTVVVTHHLPSYSLCHPRFGGDCDGGFAFEGDHLLSGEHRPALWVAGHTHDTIDRVVGETRVVVNPAGYAGEWSTTMNTFLAQGPKFVEVAA